MADIVSIGIAYDTSQLTAGTKQVQSAMQQLTQAEQQAQTATQALTQSNTQAAQALAQEAQAAKGSAQATQSMEAATKQAAQAMGQQLATAVAQAAQALIQQQREAKKADDELRKAAKAAEELAKAEALAASAAGPLRSAMQSFGQQVGAFGLAQLGVMGLQQALGTLQSAFTDLIRTGVQIAQLRQSFAAIAGAAGAGGREFQFVVKTANELGLALETVATQYRSLTAATRGTALEGTATRELFVALTSAARAYGLSNEALGRAITAVQQIASKGKVTMEELRGQLGEALPGAVQILARAFGVTTTQLEDMVGKGLDATEALKKLTSQLGIEVPKGAERAGSGIQQLGNEIFLLKGRIASGLLPVLDSALGKLAELMRKGREVDEQEDRRVERRATREQGIGTPLEELSVKSREAILTKSRELMDAEKAYDTAKKQSGFFGLGTQGEGSFLGIKTQVTLARERVEQLKKELEALRVRQTLERQEAIEQVKRRNAYAEGFKQQQDGVAAAETANKGLQDQLAANQKSQEDFNKSAALTPELYGKLTGTLKEQNLYLEARRKINEASLKDVTESLVRRGPGTGAVPPELLAKHAALRKAVEDDTAAIERNKAAIAEAEKARTKAEQLRKKTEDDAEAARKKQEQEDEEAARKEIQRFKDIGDAEDRKFEQLTRLAAQYGTTKAARDENTASMLAAELQTSQYAKASRDLAADIEAVVKAEAKLPALRADAARSAGTLTDLQRLEKQLEPRRRDMSRAEQLAATRRDIAALPMDEQSRVEALARADEKIKEALDTERWQEWSDFATESIDRVGDAITQFAFHGKLTFKEMTTAIAEDFFRMSLRMVTESAFSSAGGKGGWLELLLKAGKTALSIGAGAGGGGGTFAGGDAPGMQHGGTALAGRPYWVGEAGPELVVPQQTSTVIPHQQSMQMAAPTVIVNVHGVQDASSFVQSRGAVQRAIAGGVSQAYRGL